MPPGVRSPWTRGVCPCLVQAPEYCGPHDQSDSFWFIVGDEPVLAVGGELQCECRAFVVVNSNPPVVGVQIEDVVVEEITWGNVVRVDTGQLRCDGLRDVRGELGPPLVGIAAGAG